MAEIQSAIPQGVWCPVVSIYKDTKAQEVDLEASAKYFAYLLRGGINGLVIQGSTAEAALLSREEKIDLLKIARETAIDLGVPSFPIAAGISGQSTAETLRLVDDAAAAGATFGLLLPPSYWPKGISNSDIVDFYKEVADHSRIPIICYNVSSKKRLPMLRLLIDRHQFPGVTSGIDLSVDVLSQVAVHPNIVGVKLTCANAGKVTCLTARFPPSQFAVFSGQSDWLLPCLIGGGMGCVTGIGNVFPKSVSRLYALWQAGKIEEARKLQGQVALAEFACKRGLNATKFATAYFAGPLAGITNQAAFHPRKPYKPASPALQEQTIATIQHLIEFEKSLPDSIAGLSSQPKTKLVNGNGVNGHHTSELRSHFTLNTGAKIPSVGFGTWKAAPGDAAASVKAAFESGYRHFDCAPLYFNEAEIGEVFKSAPIPRSEYFVTTKLWSSDHQRVAKALDQSLQDLGLDYVDLYLMHWPVTLPADTGAEYGKENRKEHAQGWDFRDTWQEMEKLVETGKVRAIGVANFSTVNLEKLLTSAKMVPAVNQTEIQPLLPQDKLFEFCQAKGIHQTAFGPLGGSGSTLHEEPVIVDIAKKRGVATGNVMLSWGIAKGWSVIPKSINPKRIATNLRENFVLSEDEMRQIDELAKTNPKRFNRPDWGTTIFHDDADAGVKDA